MINDKMKRLKTAVMGLVVMIILTGTAIYFVDRIWEATRYKGEDNGILLPTDG